MQFPYRMNHQRQCFELQLDHISISSLEFVLGEIEKLSLNPDSQAFKAAVNKMAGIQTELQYNMAKDINYKNGAQLGYNSGRNYFWPGIFESPCGEYVFIQHATNPPFEEKFGGVFAVNHEKVGSAGIKGIFKQYFDGCYKKHKGSLSSSTSIEYSIRSAKQLISDSTVKKPNPDALLAVFESKNEKLIGEQIVTGAKQRGYERLLSTEDYEKVMLTPIASLRQISVAGTASIPCGEDKDIRYTVNIGNFRLQGSYHQPFLTGTGSVAAKVSEQDIDSNVAQKNLNYCELEFRSALAPYLK